MLGFGKYYDKPIGHIQFPDTITRMGFMSDIIYQIVHWPVNLRKIYMKGNSPIDRAHIHLPRQLNELQLSGTFNQSLDDVDWPDLEKIEIGKAFSESIENVQWPETLKSIIISKTNALRGIVPTSIRVTTDISGTI